MEKVCENRPDGSGACKELSLLQRRRFGMKPGLDAIRGVCAALGDPQQDFRAIHVAGTNGKGAVAAILDACLRAAGLRTGRYTSPHLVRVNERFFLDGQPIGDDALEECSDRVEAAIARLGPSASELTYFEALTAVAFLLYSRARPDYAVLETGLGGRLDATNVCCPALCVVTKIGLDHCDWLGDTIEKIAAEKAGIVKPGVPVVLGANEPAVCEVVSRRAAELGAPFVYAPDLADESEIPGGFSLGGAFNRENAVTALAVLRTLEGLGTVPTAPDPCVGFNAVYWPGRYQRLGAMLVDVHGPRANQRLLEGAYQRDVLDAFGALILQLGDVNHPFLAGSVLDERTDRNDPGDRRVVGLADHRLEHDRLDDRLRTVDALLLDGGDIDRTVVLDIDLGAGIGDDLLDHLSAAADDLADLVGVDLQADHLGSVLGDVRARRGDRLQDHFVDDIVSALMRRSKRLANDLGGKTVDLQVHLDRGDALVGTGDLKVHIAVEVLKSLNVDHGGPGTVVLGDQTAGDTGDRRLDRHARVHQGEGGTAD